jgi:hypothetical protein
MSFTGAFFNWVCFGKRTQFWGVLGHFINERTTASGPLALQIELGKIGNGVFSEGSSFRILLMNLAG